MTTAERDRGVRPHEPGTHRLVVADTGRLVRMQAAQWVGHELARGSKVYYKGWPANGGTTQPWIAGPDGAAGAREALRSGQLEFADFPTVIERCGGTTDGLFRLQSDECARAVDEGWPSVAMSQESAHRPMADQAEAAELARQEGGYDVLATRWPLRTLCQLAVDEENPGAAWETATVHFREIVDGHWSAGVIGGRWHLYGILDAPVAQRFSAALHGALRSARGTPGLEIDLSAVESMDFACAQILMLHARSMSRELRLVLYGTRDHIRYLIIAAGRPRSLLFDDELDAG